jgi:predicted nucleotidyltransferase
MKVARPGRAQFAFVESAFGTDQQREGCRRLRERGERAFRVGRLELFGSAATGSFDAASSDLDFLVEFANLQQGEWADAYFGLKESLEELFGRPVDLVMPSAVTNPYLLASIDTSRIVLYAA